jgi:hypothetical protein
MSVGGETLISGPYTATYDGVALGLFQGEGGLPTLTSVGKAKGIASTNLYGLSTIDSIHLGRDMFFDAILMEYKATNIRVLWPFGNDWLSLGTPVGTLKRALAKALVLTAVAGTPAAATPATLTMSKAILADDHQGKIIYGPELRTIPLRLQLYAYDRDAGAGVDLGFGVET